MKDLSLYRRALASVAGLRFNKMPHGPDEIAPGLWKPWDDVAQAIQVLEAVRYKTLRFTISCQWRDPGDPGWVVRIEEHGGGVSTCIDDKLPSAICSAVIAALDLKPEGGEVKISDAIKGILNPGSDGKTIVQHKPIGSDIFEIVPHGHVVARKDGQFICIGGPATCNHCKEEKRRFDAGYWPKERA